MNGTREGRTVLGCFLILDIVTLMGNFCYSCPRDSGCKYILCRLTVLVLECVGVESQRKQYYMYLIEDTKVVFNSLYFIILLSIQDLRHTTDIPCDRGGFNQSKKRINTTAVCLCCRKLEESDGTPDFVLAVLI
jgi:hypothetical protein